MTQPAKPFIRRPEQMIRRVRFVDGPRDGSSVMWGFETSLGRPYREYVMPFMRTAQAKFVPSMGVGHEAMPDTYVVRGVDVMGSFEVRAIYRE